MVDTFPGKHFDASKFGGGVMSVAVHPSGNFVAVGCGNGKRCLLSLLSKKLIFESEAETGACIWSIGFSPDGNYMLSGSANNLVKCEYIASQTHMLPSFVQAHYFRNDCTREEYHSDTFSWRKSDTFTALKESPRRILEVSL